MFALFALLLAPAAMACLHFRRGAGWGYAGHEYESANLRLPHVPRAGSRF